MPSMSLRWVSLKFCAVAWLWCIASSLIEHDLFGKPLHTFPDHALVALLARHRLGRDDVVGLDPSGRADSEACFRARGELACGLVVAAQIGGLGGGKGGLRIVSLPSISHGKLGKAERRLALACDCRPQDGNRLVSIGLVVGGDQRLPQ